MKRIFVIATMVMAAIILLVFRSDQVGMNRHIFAVGAGGFLGTAFVVFKSQTFGKNS